jgi:hypothetical protein
MIDEYWIGSVQEEFDGGRNRGTIPAFAWLDWEEPQITSASVPARTVTEHLPNTSPESYRYAMQ